MWIKKPDQYQCQTGQDKEPFSAPCCVTFFCCHLSPCGSKNGATTAPFSTTQSPSPTSSRTIPALLHTTSKLQLHWVRISRTFYSTLESKFTLAAKTTPNQKPSFFLFPALPQHLTHLQPLGRKRPYGHFTAAPGPTRPKQAMNDRGSVAALAPWGLL